MTPLEETLAADPQRCVVLRERCPACGGAARRTVVEAAYGSAEMAAARRQPDLAKRRYLEPLMAAFPYRVVECTRCELVWQPIALSPEVEAELYSAERTSFQPGKRTRKWLRPAAKFSYYRKLVRRATLPFVLTPGKAPEAIRVLDFGAGWGEFLLAARAHGYDCRAAELNRDKRDHLRRLGFECVELPSERRFDFIHSDQVFEHLVDPLVHLRELRRHLAPGGHVLVVVPTLTPRAVERSLPALEPAAVLQVYPFFHLNFFSPRSFAALGARAGLEALSLPGPLRTALAGDARTRLTGSVKRLLAAAFPRARRFFTGEQLFRAAS